MKKICVIGAFDFEKMSTGGQPVKTRELFYALGKKYGTTNICYVETIGWKNHPVQLLRQIKKCARNADKIIMLPASNGLGIFARLLAYYKRKYNISVYYDVIGGWLPEIVQQKKQLFTPLSTFDGIWVETTSMKNNLETIGFRNVTVVPNFKHLNVLEKCELKTEISYPLKVCTFSRVMKEKGIEDAVQVVKDLNRRYNKNMLHLDVFGQIDESFKERFEELQNTHKDCMTYCGVVPPNKSVETIKFYFALLFPTRFYTEGIPGTLIDAYSAGVPVISSRWENAEDVFVENVTGWSYEFDNYEDFLLVFDKAVMNPDEFVKMKQSALGVAKRYKPEEVIKQIDLLMFGAE